MTTDDNQLAASPAAGPRLFRNVHAPRARILFLGYSEAQTRLLQELADCRCEVWHTDARISSAAGYDVVISYGYRHIIRKDVIIGSKAPIVNLHISFLPYNRGAHPNFWSFYDRTPSGVSIHLIDEGVDTGPILFQKRVTFEPDERTFTQTHKRLLREIEALFVANIEAIIDKGFIARPQAREGTFHRAADLPKEFSGWDADISSEISRLRRIRGDN